MVLRTELLGERRQRRCGISKDLRKTLGRSFLDEGGGFSLCNWGSNGRNGAERESGEDGEGLEQHSCGCGGGRKLSERRVGGVGEVGEVVPWKRGEMRLLVRMRKHR